MLPPANRLRKEKEIKLQGFPICSGIAIGTPFFFFDIEEKIPEVKVEALKGQPAVTAPVLPAKEDHPGLPSATK